MSLRRLLGTIHNAEPLLSSVGWINVAVLLFSVVSIGFDPREILGLNPWIKPIKFAASITIYVWTLAWFLRYLRNPRWLLHLIRGTVALAMLTEIACVWVQSARGEASHFNIATGFDGSVFAVMTGVYLLNTIAVVGVLGLFFWDVADLATVYLWAIRIGLFLFFLGSLEGMMMVLNQAHTVGAADGGPGLPFLNWSTQAGDLRAAHFIGLHSLQVIPLAGHLLSRSARLATGLQGLLLALFTAGYAGLFYALYRMALSGRPLIAM